MTRRQAQALALYQRLGSYTETAREMGITRQAVLQLLDRADPHRTIRDSVKRRRQQAPRLRRLQTLLERRLTCQVCGSWIIRSRARYACSVACQKVWEAARYLLDGDYREAQKRRIAEWKVSHPHKSNETDLRYSLKVLNGGVIERKGRWAHQDSKGMRVLRERAPERYRELCEEVKVLS